MPAVYQTNIMLNFVLKMRPRRVHRQTCRSTRTNILILNTNISSYFLKSHAQVRIYLARHHDLSDLFCFLQQLPDIVKYIQCLEIQSKSLTLYKVASSNFHNNDKNRMYDTEISLLPGMSVNLYDFLKNKLYYELVLLFLNNVNIIKTEKILLPKI